MVAEHCNIFFTVMVLQQWLEKTGQLTTQFFFLIEPELLAVAKPAYIDLVVPIHRAG